MYERFNDEARNLVQAANEFARLYNHEYIGTEHMLLAVVNAKTSQAYHMLEVMRIDPVAAGKYVTDLVQRGPEMTIQGKRPHTPRMKRVIEYAMEEARNAASPVVGTEHVLLGLIREPEGIAGETLRKYGANLDYTRTVIAAHVPPQTTDDLRAGMRAIADYVVVLARELGFDLGPGEPKITSTMLQFDNFEWRVLSAAEIALTRQRLGPIFDIRQVVREALEAKIAAVTRQAVEPWRGIAKLTEECGELLQVLGKAGAFPTGDHPDGKGPIGPRLVEELADVKAAIRVFEELNPELSVDTEHDARFLEKLAKFRAWGLRGVRE